MSADTPSDYRVDLDLYQGPLALLLHLVRKSEIEIGEVAIGRVAGQFLQHLDALRALDLESAGEFLAVASILMEIKSKAALPQESEEVVDENLEEEIGRSDLVKRLLEYRRFKEAATELETRAAQWQERYPRLAIEQPTEGADPAEDRIREVELWDLVSGLGRVLHKKEKVGHASLQREEIPVALLVEQIAERVRREGRVAFSDCFAPADGRERIVGTFLAILELVRHHGFQADQPEDFGDIWIKPPAAELSDHAESDGTR